MRPSSDAPVNRTTKPDFNPFAAILETNPGKYPEHDPDSEDSPAMIYQMIYSSRASRPMTESDLAAILTLSRIRNAQTGTSGILLFGKGEFVQFLEGDEDRVKTLVNRSIRKDRRHESFNQLYENRQNARGFKNWAMAYGNLSDTNVRTIGGQFGLNDLDDLLDVIRRPESIVSCVLSNILKDLMDETEAAA